MAAEANPTKERLLLTAERLFAEYGIEAVTARQIALAAGQRNQSAIRYHFGSKDDVIRALLARRVAEINERRRAMLAELAASGAAADARALLGAIVLPLAERVERDAAGRDYVRFLAHLFSDRRRRDRWLEETEDAALLRQIYRRLRALTPQLPERLWDERLRFVVGGAIHALADRERLRALGETRAALPQDAFVRNLLDAAAGALGAPPSPALLADRCGDARSSDEERLDGTHG